VEVLLDLRASLAVLERGQDAEVDLVQGQKPGPLLPAVHERGVERGVHVLDDALVDVPFESLFGERLDLEEIEDAVVDDRDPGLFLQDHVDEHGFRHVRRHSRRSSAGRIASRRPSPGRRPPRSSRPIQRLGPIRRPNGGRGGAPPP